MARKPYRNPLAYPGGNAPGFNPLHPASRGMSTGGGLSVVASGGNLIDLLSGQRGALTGSPAAGILDKIGPKVSFSSTQICAFGGKTTATPTIVTAAAIFQPHQFADYQNLVSLNTANGNLYIEITTGIPYFWAGGAQTKFSNFVCAADTPYFIAVSYLTASTSNWIGVNLKTGQVTTQIVSTSDALTVSSGTYYVGSHYDGTYPADNLSAAMLNQNVFLSIAQLQQWAADPWAFWYPDADTADDFAPITITTSGRGLIATVRPVGQFKRPGIPRIDCTHPLANKLAFYWFDTGAGFFIDLISGRMSTPGSGNTGIAGVGHSAFGSALKFPATGSDVKLQQDTIAGPAAWAAPYTFAVGFNQLGSTSTVGVQGIFTLADSAGNDIFALYYQGANHINFDLGNGIWGNGVLTTTFPPINAYSCAVLKSSGGTTAGSGTFLLNNVSIASSYNSGANLNSLSLVGPVRYIVNGTAINSSDHSNGAMVYWAAAWNGRELTASEANQLYIDPYCFLVWPEDELCVGGQLPILRQKHFRFRTDANAVDGAPTWAAPEDLGQ